MRKLLLTLAIVLFCFPAAAQRFDASILYGHQQVLSNFVGRLQAGEAVVPTAQELLDLGNLAGALNYWASLAPPPAAVCGPDDLQVSIPWGDYDRRTTNQIGPFGENRIAVQFVVPPAVVGPFSSSGYFSVAEFQGPPWPRHLTLSRFACDFRSVDPTGVAGPVAESYGKQTTIFFNVQGPAGADALQPSGVYYMNIRNWEPTLGTSGLAPGQTAPAGFSFIWPHN